MSDPAVIIAARLAELWRRSLPLTRERVAALHAACSALSLNPADAEARAAGREAAHKLSGVLGTFGLPRGSELAAEIEAVFKSDAPLTHESLTALAAQVRELDAVIATKP